MLAVLDCGTTNIKFYLVDKDGACVGEHYSRFSCRTPDGKIDLNGYRRMLAEIVQQGMIADGYQYSDLEIVVAFGMITSDMGLCVIPHLVAPVGIEELRKGLYVYEDNSIFPNDVKLILVRGVRNYLEKERDPENINLCDYMRGEETQIAGVLSLYKPNEPVNIITLGTHFKVTHLNSCGQIEKSMTTMSGQLFDSIVNGTIIGKSLHVDPTTDYDADLAEIVKMAKASCERYGFSRTVLLPRFMESFTNFTSYERRLFLDAILSVEDYKSMSEYTKPESDVYASRYFIIGQNTRSRLIAQLIKEDCDNADITIIDGKEKNRIISIAGILELIRDYL